MFNNFKQAPKKQYTSEQLKAFKFTDDSLLAIYLDMLDSYILDYNKSKEYNGDVAYDLLTIRENCDSTYADNTQVEMSIIALMELKRHSTNDIIVNQIKLATLSLMSIN